MPQHDQTSASSSQQSARSFEGKIQKSGDKLVLQDSVFRGRFNGREARFGRTVDLSGCTFEQGLTFEGARIGLTHVVGAGSACAVHILEKVN